jgi:uncharacterized protein YecE (DUF72 family)
VPAGRRRAIRIGCSGWNYASWKQVFYEGRPARAWLEHYAHHFDTVEVNNTFYRLPRRESVATWEQTVKDGFCFAVKASRYLTHIKRLRDLGPGLERFAACIEPLVRSPKLGPILWQLPPNFARDEERLASAVARFPRGQRHAIEFRHASWFTDDVYALLRDHGVALVLTGGVEVFTAPWTYVRFHGGTRGHRGNYSRSELEEWARRFERWGAEVEIYAYFNNDWEAFAIKNALWLKQRLSS